jgi:hypothetical protein
VTHCRNKSIHIELAFSTGAVGARDHWPGWRVFRGVGLIVAAEMVCSNCRKSGTITFQWEKNTTSQIKIVQDDKTKTRRIENSRTEDLVFFD